MIFYNVTIYVKKEVESEWLEWMKTTHIPEVMEAGGFLRSKIYKVLIPSGEPDEITYSIQYECKSLDNYLKYSEKEALRLQREHTIKYQNKIKTARAVIEEI